MKKITQLRKEKGLSQAKLAQLADINPTSLSRIEAGKEKPFGRAQKLADALDWKFDANLLFEEVENVADDETLTEAYFWLKDIEEMTEDKNESEDEDEEVCSPLETCVAFILTQMDFIITAKDEAPSDSYWRIKALCEGTKTVKESLEWLYQK